MENKSHAFLAGLFTLLLGVGVLVVLYWLGGKKDLTREYIVVTKQNVGGLNPQANVRYRGISVGKVSRVELDAKDVRNILIHIQIQPDVPVTKGTTAKLAYQGVTGIAHVLLEQGGSDTTLLPEKDKDGQPPRIAMNASLIDEIGEAGPQIVKQAKEVMNGLNALLNEKNREKFATLLSNLEGTSGQLKPAVENLNGTLSQVRKVLNDENIQSLSRSAREVGPLLAETRTLVGKLQNTADKLDAAIGDSSSGGAAALMPRVNELASDLSATSRQLSRVLKIIEESPQSLVFGAPPIPPGPGEPGFTPPAGK